MPDATAAPPCNSCRMKRGGRMALAQVVKLMTRQHGLPEPPTITDPFEQILFENASYLVDDERRARVFAALAARIGTTPEAILKAKREELEEAVKDGGMRPLMRAQKLIDAAQTALALEAPLAALVK